MKLLIVLMLMAAAYTYMLLHTTSLVLTQTQHLNATYQFVAKHSDELSNGN